MAFAALNEPDIGNQSQITFANRKGWRSDVGHTRFSAERLYPKFICIFGKSALSGLLILTHLQNQQCLPSSLKTKGLAVILDKVSWVRSFSSNFA